jgi:hypothetical protein
MTGGMEILDVRGHQLDRIGVRVVDLEAGRSLSASGPELSRIAPRACCPPPNKALQLTPGRDDGPVPPRWHGDAGVVAIAECRQPVHQNHSTRVACTAARAVRFPSRSPPTWIAPCACLWPC